MLTKMVDDLHDWTERRSRSVFVWLMLAAVLLALGLRALHLTDAPSRSPDERVYTNWALQIAQGGLSAYRGIFQTYVSDPSQWIYPSPTRIVHVLLFTGVMKVTGATGAQAGACVSWLLGIGSVLVLARLGRRFFGAFVGVLAAFFLGTYVVEFEFCRRAWAESTATFLTLLLVYAACALDRQPSSGRWLAGFLAAGTACVLAKETSLFAYALCGGWLCARQLFVAKRSRRALVLAALGLGSVGFAFGVLALLAGSASNALAGWVHVFGNGLGSNEWGALYASGPWHQFIELLWLLAPFTAAMAATGVVAVLAPTGMSGRLAGAEPGARACASLAVLLTLGLVAACAFGPNLQYLRIMAPADPLYCLLAAIGVRALLVLSEDVALGRAHALLFTALPLLLGAACVRDYALYRDVVVRLGHAGHDRALDHRRRRAPEPSGAGDRTPSPRALGDPHRGNARRGGDPGRVAPEPFAAGVVRARPGSSRS